MARRYRGSVRATAAGGWQARWREGRRRQSKTFPPGTKKRDAEDWLGNKLIAVRESEKTSHDPIEDITFDALADLYEKTKALELADGGATNRCYLRVHLRPFFGRTRLSQIGTPLVEAFKRSRLRSVSKVTVNHHLVLLSSLLTLAVEHRHLEPDARPRIRKYKVPEQPFRYLETDDEVQAFLAAARADRCAMLLPLYATGIYAGLRVGELAGLRKADIDWSASVINVRHSYDAPPKSQRLRHVPLMGGLRGVLRDWLDRPKKWRRPPRNRPIKKRPDLVFTTATCTMLDKDSRYFKELLVRVLGRADFSEHKISAHGLRHTFASHFLMRGGSIWRLQRYLGHEDPQTTMRYAHLAPSSVAEDLDRLDFAI